MTPRPADLALLSDLELEAAYAAELAKLGISSEEEAHRVLDLGTRDLLERLSRIEVVHPLAAAVLWVQEDAPYDQRRLVRSLVHPLTLVLGGNRSGKTYAILECLVAFALGRDHPAVAAWLLDNDLDPEMIPVGPGECYAVAPSAASSIKIHRRDIGALLPRNAHWRGMNAYSEAFVEVAVPGYEQKAVIWFKSADQGHRAFKGDQVRFVAITEEPEGEEGRLVLDECMRACAATGGRVVLEMTPQNGMTWVHDDLVEDRRYDCRLIVLDSAHNRMVSDYDSLQRWLASLTDEERRMRQHGQFVDRAGLVYSGWSRGTGDRWGLGHLCEPFEIPKEWPRFRGHDWGQTAKNGTACVWGALGDDDTLYVYRTYYLPNEPDFGVHARKMAGMQLRGETFAGAWGDHEQEAIDACLGMGMRIALADKDVAGGISRCAARLHVVGKRPRLKVFRGCGSDGSRQTDHDFVREIESYRRDPNKRDGAPLKKNDHLMDAWRYLENGLVEWDEVRRNTKATMNAMRGILARYGG